MHRNVSKCRPHSGDICTRGNNLKTSFSYMGQNVPKMYIDLLGYLGGVLRGFSITRLGLSCFPAIVAPISMYMSCQIRKQCDKKILSLDSKYGKKYFFFILEGGGVLGALTSNPGERKFQGSKTSSQSRHVYNEGKNNHQFL